MPLRPESENKKPNFNVAQKIKTAFQRFQALAQGLIKVPRAELEKKIKEDQIKKASARKKP